MPEEIVPPREPAPKKEIADYCVLEPSEVISRFKSSEKGLSEEEAKNRLAEYGYNELQKKKKHKALLIFISQFKSPLVLLLVGAGILSLFIGEILDSAAIFAIILLNAILGFFQEYKADKALQALEKISSPMARVMRGGKELRIPAREVVPGDIIVLEAGDVVPADARLIKSSGLQIDEASLTGESVPSSKTTDKYESPVSVADQENMAFMGTIVTYGNGLAVVTATGMKTEFGKIAQSLQETGDTKTPLQGKFEELSKQIGIIAALLVILVLIVGSIQGVTSIEKMILLSVALMVSTVPNSLPLVVTIGLSRGTKQLAKENMLIKSLPAAESLGSATIICSDKTGTITKNQMTVTDIYFNQATLSVTGSGYQPEGKFISNEGEIDPKKLEGLLKIGLLCNNAKLNKTREGYEIIGDPTEGSLIALARKGLLDEKHYEENLIKVSELPFDSDRKRMSVIFKDKETGKLEAYIKGAPDLLLKKCSRIYENGSCRELTEKDRERIMGVNTSFAKKALRVLGFAFREIQEGQHTSENEVEKDLVFMGLVGMIDPPREGVEEAIAKCREAGIKVMIITGDHALTTKAIAEKIGLFGEGDIVISGEELDTITDGELEAKIESVRIVARALPVQKLRIVQALQKKGHIVAMTGDGVNDAPALKKADIGIAMGITGTDVAKEVADATLVDDNFATIVKAIETGRNIYDSLIRSAKFFLACNMGEITAVFSSILLKLPLPMIPLQILLMNMLTDNLPALGLGFEPNDERAMKRPPRNPKEKPISNRMYLSIVAFGLIMGIGTLVMFQAYLGEGLIKAQTVAFTTLVIFQMFAVISSRTLYPSIKHLNLLSNKYLLCTIILSVGIQAAVVYWGPLQAVFGTVSLAAADWIKIVGFSSLGFVLMEASKYAMPDGRAKREAGK
ncbi:MAG: cation-translocating P-type ATPase [Candidatus Aenigmarchaeota archaeon]|nr:cation-translocating P-type ATPase [Candidatus Aenigmarchaeota archaeon]